MFRLFITSSFKPKPTSNTSSVLVTISHEIFFIKMHSLVQPIQSPLVLQTQPPHRAPTQEASEFYDVRDVRFSVLEKLEHLACQLREFPCFRTAQLLHVQVYKCGFLADYFLPNTLIHGYSRMDDLSSAHKLFDEMPLKNSVTWSVLLSGHSKNNMPYEALNLFVDIFQSGIIPNCFAFGSILRACQDLGSSSLNVGMQIHALLWKLGLESDPTTCNALISMYGNCSSSPAYAHLVFNNISIKNLVSWNSLISVYSQAGNVSACFKLFLSMQQEAWELFSRPSEYTFGSLIAASCSSIERGKSLLQQLLTRIQKSGFLQDLYVGSALVSGFTRFGLIDYARKIFEKMEEKNAVTLNGLLVGLVTQGRNKEAAEIFRKEKDMVGTNCDSYVVLLSAFSEFSMLEDGRDKGKEVHAHVIRAGLMDVIAIGNGLVNMYAKCGAIIEACSVFRLMVAKDSVSWNSIISSLDQNNLYEEAIGSFISMRKAGFKPTNFTLISALSAGATMGWALLGEQIHCEGLKSGFDSDTSVSNALLGLYAQTGCISSCRKVFNLMTEFDQISWNTIIGGFSLCTDSDFEAMEYYLNMLRVGYVPNWITFINILSAAWTPGDQLHASALKYKLADDVTIANALICWYGKSGMMEDCEKIFSRMGNRKDEISWNSMISGYIHNDLLNKAMELVRYMMQKGQKLDAFTFATVLSACASVATLQRGMEVHACQMRACLETDVVVGSTIIDMYSKCGRVDYASRVFNLMPVRNVYSWNSMISGYARHGRGQDALEIFKRMKVEGPCPDHVTFVGVLSALSHVGLVEEGFQHFESMSRVYNLSPHMEHYCCMVDLLGRTGNLAKVEDFVDKMPMEPNVLVWRTVLGACCRWSGQKTDLGRRAADMLMQLEPQNAVNYVLLSNMYAFRGNWGDVAKARRLMRESGGRKEIGCSWVTMRDGVHVFVSGDESHPENSLIQEKLKELQARMKDLGYVPQTKFALYDVDMESKEMLLNHHSEKLAVAFILTRKSEMTIRIMKNLRTCGDCHVAFKYISRITGRDIILRDSSRFHHFIEGDCSCGDYW